VTHIIVNRTRQVIIDSREVLKNMGTATPKLEALLGEMKVLCKLRTKLDKHRKLHEEWEVMPTDGYRPPELMLFREESVLFEELLGEVKLEKFQPD
jgi:hypothetical protein